LNAYIYLLNFFKEKFKEKVDIMDTETLYEKDVKIKKLTNGASPYFSYYLKNEKNPMKYILYISKWQKT